MGGKKKVKQNQEQIQDDAAELTEDAGNYSEDDGDYSEDDGVTTSRTFDESTDQNPLLKAYEDGKEFLKSHWYWAMHDPQRQMRETWKQFSNSPIATGLLILSLVAIAIGLPFLYSPQRNVPNERFLNFRNDILSIVKRVHNVRPETSTRLIQSLTYSARRLSGIDDGLKQKQPIVVLFVATDLEQLESLLHELEFAIRNSTDAHLSSFECKSSESRMDFESQVFNQLNLAQKRHKFVLFRNIDRLSNTSPLVLHSLADNESSPFSDAVIFATITFDKLPANSFKTKECTQLISDHLLKRWASDELQPDQIYPIISRLTSAPICMK